MLNQQAKAQPINSNSNQDLQLIEDPWELPDLDVKISPCQSWQLPPNSPLLLTQGGNPNALCLPSPHSKPAQLLVRDWLKLGTDKTKKLTLNLKETLGLLYWLQIITC
ncbi:MAG: hypothetical protein HC763_24620 [Hydrococcus sp. CRU_1_1]|nr:hypothetical protein [Hydrococcus sp. CRU_1_1]NJQ98483.1 hypothetical protein [Hydrococcus sp. CSU_1_8]